MPLNFSQKIPFFRWIVPGELAASAMPFSIQEIKDSGIDIVVSLVPDSEQAFHQGTRLERARKSGLIFHTIAIPELQAPTKHQLAYFLRIMAEARAGTPKKVLIHCVGGVGRAGTMAAAYLIARKGVFLEKAYKIIIEGLRRAQFDALASNPKFIEKLRKEGKNPRDFFESLKVHFPESPEQERFLLQAEKRFLVFSRNNAHENIKPKKRLKRKPRRPK
ncbi:MAG: dual specificity protein phosphatase family protein [Candidatus ainarchaeum sp.]|nr:dual specificity protein phosphatase family protein [Candidatus ainarchaeum sp.]